MKRLLLFILIASSVVAQTHIKAATVDVSSTGIFTPNQSNPNSTFIVNGLNTVAQYQSSPNNTSEFTTDIATFGLLIPSSSTVLQADDVAAYITNNSATTFPVPLYGYCLVPVANGFCWGVNTVISSIGGGGNANLKNEFDVNVGTTTDTAYGVNVNGYWAAHPATSDAFLVNVPGGPGASTGWGASFVSGPGASQTAFFAQPVSLIGGAASQKSVWESLSSLGAPLLGSINLNNTGGMVLAPVNGQPVILGTVMTSGVPPTCTLTSGGGTGPFQCGFDFGSTNAAGVLQITTGTGSPASTGTITFTFNAPPFGLNKPDCIYMASNAGTGQWGALATFSDTTPSTTSDVFTWTNATGGTPAGVALSASTQYWINYQCWEK